MRTTRIERQSLILLAISLLLTIATSSAMANTSTNANKNRPTQPRVATINRVIALSGASKVALTLSPARVGIFSTLIIAPVKGSPVIPTSWTLSFSRPVSFLGKEILGISNKGAKVNIKIGFLDTHSLIVSYKGIDTKGKVIFTHWLVRVASVKGAITSPEAIVSPTVKPTNNPIVSSGATPTPEPSKPNPVASAGSEPAGIPGVTIPQTTWGTNNPLVLPPADWKANWDGYIAPFITDVSILSCTWNPSPVDKQGNILSTTPGEGAFDIIVKYGLTGGNFREMSQNNNSGYKMFITDYSPKEISYNTSEFYVVQPNSIMNDADRTEMTFDTEDYFAPMNWNKNLYLVGENQDILERNSLVFNGRAPLPIPEGVCK
jgi:hypothetical protein